MNGLLFEPLKYYNTEAKEKHKSNVTSHFDDLVKQSRVDVEANRATVKKYKAELDKIDKINAKIRRFKLLFGLLITLTVIGAIVLFVGIYNLPDNTALGTGLIVGGAVAAIASVIVAIKCVRPIIKSSEEIRAKLTEVANGYLAEAHAQMAPLNALFKSSDTLDLIEKTMPELDFYPTYTREHQQLLIDEYDYIDLTDDETSVTDTLSGKAFGNPFLYERYLEHTMGTQTYTGSITIHWTETSRDSKGNLRTVHKSQTLTASVQKPKPFYKLVTHLGYGSQAAPDLSFSRTESDTDELSDRALARRIRKGERELQKRAEKAATEGGSFHEMANTEFDVLFGAHNRNHEVQFRLMFTPLAQTNMTDLLRSKEGYGDDFNFIKQGRYNIIKTLHAQNWRMTVTKDVFASYDIDACRENFISFNEEYFKSVFFDFAPLMAIPAYQDEPVASMKPLKDIGSNYTQYEHEVLANAIGAASFAHPDTATDIILKTTPVATSGNVDLVRVTAYSYAAYDRVDHVTMMGRDGRFHSVPVHWIEYIPLVFSRDMALKAAPASLNSCNAYMHGIGAALVEDGNWKDLIK